MSKLSLREISFGRKSWIVTFWRLLYVCNYYFLTVVDRVGGVEKLWKD